MVEGVYLTGEDVDIAVVVAVEAEIDSILHNKVVEVIYKMRHARKEMTATVMKSSKARMGNHKQTSNVLDAFSLDIVATSVHT